MKPNKLILIILLQYAWVSSFASDTTYKTILIGSLKCFIGEEEYTGNINSVWTSGYFEKFKPIQQPLTIQIDNGFFTHEYYLKSNKIKIKPLLINVYDSLIIHINYKGVEYKLSIESKSFCDLASVDICLFLNKNSKDNEGKWLRVLNPSCNDNIAFDTPENNSNGFYNQIYISNHYYSISKDGVQKSKMEVLIYKLHEMSQ